MIHVPLRDLTQPNAHMPSLHMCPTNERPDLSSHVDNAPQLFGNLDLIYELNKRLLADLKQAGNNVGKVRDPPSACGSTSLTAALVCARLIAGVR